MYLSQNINVNINMLLAIKSSNDLKINFKMSSVTNLLQSLICTNCLVKLKQNCMRVIGIM